MSMGIGQWELRLSDAEFQVLRDLIYERFGINLTDQKRGLVIGRLQKVLRQRGITDFSEYARQLQADRSGRMLSELVDRISTNHTFFFRENDHFVLMREQVLPELRQRHREDRDLRIWCAAAATGEEPYSLVMLLMDFFGDDYRFWRAGLLATDISEHALNIARAGRYPAERVKQVSPIYKQRYLSRVGAEWQVLPHVQREVAYRRFNLMNTTLPFKGKFDVIFCRNVMIYFDQETRAALVQRLCSVLPPGGWLFIGHSETIPRGCAPLASVRPAVYRKVE
ncbi:MAG: CheR family methyltransferase [Planctomycetota bacterium]